MSKTQSKFDKVVHSIAVMRLLTTSLAIFVIFEPYGLVKFSISLMMVLRERVLPLARSTIILIRLTFALRFSRANGESALFFGLAKHDFVICVLLLMFYLFA